MWVAAATLAVVFAGCSADVEKRRSEIYELKRDPTPENRAKIRERLEDADSDIRATALNALVTLEESDAQTLALEALTDADPFVRATAAKLVGDVGNPLGAESLAGLLRQDPDPIVRQRAAEALARLGSSAAVSGLSDALSDPMKNVRLAAVRGIRIVEPGFNVPALSRLVLDDSEWEIRVQAARALGASGDPQVATVLESAVEDPNEFVRTAAANSLAVLRRAGEEVRPDPDRDPAN